MIREEKQRQLDAVIAELKTQEYRCATLNQEYAILHAWLDGYDEGFKAGEADTIETIFPVPEPAKPIGGDEHVEHEILEVLGMGRPLNLEQLRRSFGWAHAETDSGVARLFAAQKIMLGNEGYRLLAPGDKCFERSADESPSLSNGDASF